MGYFLPSRGLLKCACYASYDNTRGLWTAMPALNKVKETGQINK